MKVVVRETMMVKPKKKTPMTKQWLSSLDLHATNFHTHLVYFYRPNDAPNFFDTKVMKDSLSWVLALFYPMAGRLKQGEDGRLLVNCQGQGALFLEAESDGVLDQFGDFAPSLEYGKLIPVVDYSLGIESFPLLVTQVTYFKCGGVSLGVGVHHRVLDGQSTFHLMKTWSDLARGLEITLPPFLDRTLLRAQDPPQPAFEHIEYQSDPTPLQVPLNETKTKTKTKTKTTFSLFKLTRNQLDMLKAKAKEDGNTIKYSTFEILSAHIWKCVSKARGLPNNLETKLIYAVDGRARFQPPLPPGFFGNVVFKGTTVTTVGDIKSKPLSYVASKIRESSARMNSDYLKSAVDYLEQHRGQKLDGNFNYTYFAMVSWVKFPIHDVDFGWGRPVFMGRTGIPTAGRCYVLPSVTNDGSLSIIIGLEAEQMKLFRNLLYAI
ncbi:shikimate O-hydroxycinnamoyltransferase-like [Bidens hawaiensis]|uniref:shikimate O-hydroxycinnamoyltransferase-like n=1 Tax=Bidens hawaiensis TaxID=980011 RepID=UPI004049F26D